MTAGASPPAPPAPLTHARLLALAIPITLSNLSTPLLGIVNTAVIGRLGDTAQLGAVALGAVIFDMLFWSFGFLRMGAAGLTAQAYGAGDRTEMGAAFCRALIIAAAAGLALIALRGAVIDASLAFMRPSAEVAGATRAYIETRIWSSPLALANAVILGSMVGRGRTDLCMLQQIAINGCNVALSFLFVSLARESVVGVAWASVAAEFVGCAIGLVLQARGGLFGLADWRAIFNPARIRRTLAVNRDIFLRTMAVIGAIGFFVRQGSQAGDAVLAGNAVLHNFFLLGGYFLDGFATAAEQTAGQAVGARDRAGFREATRLGALWCVCFGALAALVFAAAGSPLIDMVTTSEEVRASARTYLIFAALAPLVGAPAFLLDGVFIGATWTRGMRDAMFLSLAGATLIYFALRPFGNSGLWLTYNAFLALRGLTQALLYGSLERRTFGGAS